VGARREYNRSPGGAAHSPNSKLTKCVLRIEFHTVFLKKLAKFFLETEFAMMSLLVANVSGDLIEV